MNRRTENTMAKRKRTNNDLQNTTQKTKNRATRTPLKTEGERRCCGRVSSSYLRYQDVFQGNHNNLNRNLEHYLILNHSSCYPCTIWVHASLLFLRQNYPSPTYFPSE